MPLLDAHVSERLEQQLVPQGVYEPVVLLACDSAQPALAGVDPETRTRTLTHSPPTHTHHKARQPLRQ